MISTMVFFISVDVTLEFVPVALNAKKSSISGVGLRPEMEKMEMENEKKANVANEDTLAKDPCAHNVEIGNVLYLTSIAII